MAGGYDPRVRRWVLLLSLSLTAAAQAAPSAPSAPSGPSDPDLAAGTCRGHASAKEVLASLPTAVPELVVLWPRVGREAGSPCRSVGRITVVDHQGQMLTVSFVLRGRADPPPEEGFRPWYGQDDSPEEARPGPPRSEMTWLPDGAAQGVHVVVAGAPSVSEETLEGTIGFLSAVPLAGALGSPAR